MTFFEFEFFRMVFSMTFSIVAVDLEAGTLGVAVVSGSIAVGTRVPWVKEGVGAIATQAYTNTMYGSEGIKLLEQGYSPEEALSILISRDPDYEMRQVAIIDIKNRKAVHTGKFCPYWNGHIVGKNYIIIGNLIVGEKVLKYMEEVFLSSQGNLALKLLSALIAGEKAGGDRRGDRSAAIVVRGALNISERIDDDKKPAEKLYEVCRKRYSIAFTEKQNIPDGPQGYR